MNRLLGFISPFTKYLTLIGMVGAFVLGIYITRVYYTGEIAQNERAQLAQTAKYLERIMELDKEYADKVKGINKKLVTTQEKLNAELAKPGYDCPVPADGVGLLNDAINANKPGNGSK